MNPLTRSSMPRRAALATVALAAVAAQPAAGDVPLDGYTEPTIAVNPIDPLNVAYVCLFEMRVSTDRGATWQPPVIAPTLEGQGGLCGESSVTFDSQGRLFWTYFTCPSEGYNILIARCDPTTGAVLEGYPVNMSEEAEMSGNDGFDNTLAWITADLDPESPHRDRLHVIWMRYLENGLRRVHASHSSDQGATWTRRLRLDGAYIEEGETGPGHIAVAPNGDVYAAYHSVPPGGDGQVFVLRSTDGGLTFPQKVLACADGEAAITKNADGWPRIPGTKFHLEGSWRPWLLADPNTPGRIYLVVCDDPDDLSSGDASDVMIVVSTDHGATWSTPDRIDSGPDDSFQIMPTAAIEGGTGTIVVSYYDNRSGAVNSSGDYLLDLYATYSTDGGITFAPDFPVNDASFDPDAGAWCRSSCATTWWGVWGASADRVWTVGKYAGISRYDGVEWTSESGATNWLLGISGTSESDIYAVGLGGEVLHYDGTDWSAENSGTTEDLFDVWAVPGGDVVAVGNAGTILRSDGSGVWTADSSGTTRQLRDVWGSSGTDVFAVGGGGTILHYDGVSWTPEDSGTTRQLFAVWGSSSADVFAVTPTSAPEVPTDIYHYDGIAWDTHAPRHSSPVNAIHGTAGNDVYTTGGAGKVFHWDGISWDQVGGLGGEAIWVVASDDIYVTGRAGLILHWDGTSWSAQDNPGVPANPVLSIGHYNGIAVADGGIYTVWTGNWPTGGAPVGQQAMFDFTPIVATDASIATGSAPSTVLVEETFPDPFRSSTTIRYALPTAGHARLFVFDVRGRRVATLVDGFQPRGRHTLTWDGRSDAGPAVASGVYFVRLESADEVSSTRVVRTR